MPHGKESHTRSKKKRSLKERVFGSRQETKGAGERTLNPSETEENA